MAWPSPTLYPSADGFPSRDGLTDVYDGEYAVSAGLTYIFTAWVYPTVMRDFYVTLYWRDAATAYVGRSDGDQLTAPADQWTQLEITAPAPVGAEVAFPVIYGSSLAEGESFYTDDWQFDWVAPPATRFARVEFDTDTVVDRADTAAVSPPRITVAAASTALATVEVGRDARTALLGEDVTTLATARRDTALVVREARVVTLSRSSTSVALSSGVRTLTATSRVTTIAFAESNTDLVLTRDDTDSLLGEDVTSGTVIREETVIA